VDSLNPALYSKKPFCGLTNDLPTITKILKHIKKKDI